MKFTSDPSAEATLKEFGVKFSEEAIPLSQIDWEASRNNHARIVGKPVDDDLVQEYATAMEGGDAFPRIVVRKHGKKYTILGGNHRASAYELLGIKEVGAYVVTTDDQYIIDVLPRVLNRKGGRRTDKSEAYQHAIYTINKYGTTIKQAAQIYGLSPKELGNKIASYEIRERLVSQGVPAQTMDDSKLQSLRVLSDNDNVLTAAAQIIQKSKMTGSEASQFVKKVKTGRTETGRLAVVHEFEQKLGVKNERPETKKTQRLVRTRFLRSLTSVEVAIGRAQTLQRLQITEPEEQTDVSLRLTDLSGKCRRLAQSVS